MTTMTDRVTRAILDPGLLQDGEIKADGVLYFLEGQYLFRYPDGAGMKSKFVTAEDVAAAFTQREADTGWLPAGLVRQGQKAAGPFFVYSAPEQKVDVQLADGQAAVTIPIPRTVLLGIGPTYYLWALRSKHFEPEQIAFKAPFPNVHAGGMICWGQFTPPEASAQAARGVWEMFFKTPFNADLAGGKSEACKKDVREQLEALAEKKASRYPLADLVAENTGRIGSIVGRILGG